MSQPVKVFVSYAHKDESFKKELDIQLKLIGMQTPIHIWTDEDITPGQEWDNEIKQALEGADVILLLVSTDFLVSNYINDVEIKKAMERYNRGETLVIPIIIRPTQFTNFELGKFQALPKLGKPIDTWDNRDEAWLNVSQGLLKVFSSAGKRNTSGGSITTQNISTSSTQTSTQSSFVAPQTTNSQIFDDARLAIADTKIKDAIESLMDYTKTKDKDRYNALLLLLSRFNRLKKQEGLRRQDDIDISMNQITSSLSGIIEDLEKEAAR